MPVRESPSHTRFVGDTHQRLSDVGLTDMEQNDDVYPTSKEAK
ncbi:unnamed protein product [Protopolystoma xenopodis]|uniref:Uncharacterized protein n=1 Tax=Protopolystoma xenopodis TaxID=117903 RepID=A0A448X8F9_9PLAT|nr:unnamed protein product [Protopolystoma xenopodis]